MIPLINYTFWTLKRVGSISLSCRHSMLFEDLGGEYKIELAANARSVKEFDEGLTRGK